LTIDDADPQRAGNRSEKLAGRSRAQTTGRRPPVPSQTTGDPASGAFGAVFAEGGVDPELGEECVTR
jgi:hypothetical protein